MIEEIDITDLIPATLIGANHALMAIIPDIAEAVRTEIIRLAGEGLGSSSDDYIQGVQPVKYHFPSGRIPPVAVVASIALVGQLPNMIEQGWSGADMKAYYLRGRSAKTSADGGRYVDIPFRHGAPSKGASSRNFQKMGDAHIKAGMPADAGRKLGRSVHSAVKRLGPGERLKAGHSPVLRGHHKTDIHAGLKVVSKKYRNATQSQNRTWRRVSARSDASAWVHPGIEAHRFFRAASEYGGKVAGHLLQQAISGTAAAGAGEK